MEELGRVEVPESLVEVIVALAAREVVAGASPGPALVSATMAALAVRAALASGASAPWGEGIVEVREEEGRVIVRRLRSG